MKELSVETRAKIKFATFILALKKFGVINFHPIPFIGALSKEAIDLIVSRYRPDNHQPAQNQESESQQNVSEPHQS
jgi:hypothetical protein